MLHINTLERVWISAAGACLFICASCACVRTWICANECAKLQSTQRGKSAIEKMCKCSRWKFFEINVFIFSFYLNLLGLASILPKIYANICELCAGQVQWVLFHTSVPAMSRQSLCANKSWRNACHRDYFGLYTIQGFVSHVKCI